ncbi:hypothetical protein V6N11_067355 [Hibiscus sabdariffa]|uniref:Uncharacterized protein n=1 Tax=Hibiscus sabdariffa TaxID=183260 RepID=A0ABR2SQH9_9ROSI
MLRLYLCKGFNNLLEQDDKGDVSAETTGPAPAEVSDGIQISAEQSSNDNLFLSYNNANLRLVEDLEHDGGGIPNFLLNSSPSTLLSAVGLYTYLAGALELEYNIDYNLRSLNKSNFIRTELLSAETCTPSRLLVHGLWTRLLWSFWPVLNMILMLRCSGDYSDPIAGLIEFPFLPRPRISADVRFSADVFSAQFWVFSFGAASVQLLSLRFCCL